MARHIENFVGFKTLVQELRIPRPFVRGLLETMWDTVPGPGREEFTDAATLESAAGWPGKRGAFAAAAVRCGFVLPAGALGLAVSLSPPCPLLERWEALEASRASNQRRRANKASAPINDLTAARWSGVVEYFGFRCAYCHQPAKLVQEHMDPIFRGGSHTESNVVPACSDCNSRKGRKNVIEFIGGLPAGGATHHG